MDEEDYLNQEAGPSTAEASHATLPDGSVPLSKKAQKRAAKQAKMAAERPEKRRAEKLRRRENAQKLNEGFKNGTLTPEERAIYESRQAAKAVRSEVKKREKLDPGERPDFGGAVVIDLDFDDLMSEQEVTSMVGQIGYVYSANRLSERPFSALIHTSCSPTASPRIWEKMQKTNYARWSRCFWHEQGIEDLALKFGESSASAEQAAEKAGIELPSGISPSTHQLVYLSADSNNELETLSENEIYIIGGIVDRNRFKNLCQDKAEKYGIKTARLPIGRYLENLSTRKVLTVNQVFSILVEYITRQSWSEAFEAVIPQRKFETASRRERRGKSNWTNPATSNPGEIKDKGEDEDQDDEDEGMSEVEEATFDRSRTDGGNKADEEDEEAAMNV